MNHSMNRRDCLRVLGLSGLATGLGASRSQAQSVGESSGFQSSVITSRKVESGRMNASLVDGKVIEPRRELAILDTTDVLVVGGGPAGVVAAIAAKRAGAKVTLVERYGHLGGLWAGGLVLLVLGHIVQGGKQVCQGIGEEIMQRLDKLDGAIIDRRPGVNPTVDAEAVKYVMVEMIEEAGVNIFLHCWGVEAIVNESAVQGVVFESKSGRQAILAKVVVDATGERRAGLSRGESRPDRPQQDRRFAGAQADRFAHPGAGRQLGESARAGGGRPGRCDAHSHGTESSQVHLVTHSKDPTDAGL